jgi:hypothetical protein
MYKFLFIERELLRLRRTKTTSAVRVEFLLSWSEKISRNTDKKGFSGANLILKVLSQQFAFDQAG